MAGLRKQKEYDWKDSNLALFGSDTERQVKKESAQTEPAWKKAGEKIGLQIWRIVNFKVVSWPKEEYGKFYNGDSYIILNTFQEDGGEEFLYDVHFWIGAYSTQDEYATAAYKTVELDTLLDDKPIQHREVMDYESDLFKSYFKAITLLEGGAESGFRHVKPEEYKPKLFHLHGDRKNVIVKQIPMRPELDSTDVYILDMGLHIIQWNGSGSNKDEKQKGREYVLNVCEERGGKPKKEVIDQVCDEPDHIFWKTLHAGSEEDEGFSRKKKVESKNKETELYRVSDELGSLEMTLEKTGKVSRSDFDQKDVFILDDKKTVFVWIGQKASKAEKKNAMAYAHNYLKKTDHPCNPISCVPAGRENKDFKTAVAA